MGVRSATSAAHVKVLKKFDNYLKGFGISWEFNKAGATRGSLNGFLNAIFWHHGVFLTPGPNPEQSPEVSVFRKSLELSFPDTPVKRRYPFTANQIRWIVATALEWAAHGRPQFYRIAVLAILAYKTGARISELLHLTRGDVILTLEDYFRLEFKSRKNKKRRVPSFVFVGRDPASAGCCPYAVLFGYLRDMLLLYPSQRGISKGALDTLCIFPGELGGASHITYRAVYDQLREILTALGLDWRTWGWHSPRSSAITHLQDAGFQDSVIAVHTGHRDPKSLQSYSQGTVESRLRVSEALPL
jgi:integrase